MAFTFAPQKSPLGNAVFVVRANGPRITTMRRLPVQPGGAQSGCHLRRAEQDLHGTEHTENRTKAAEGNFHYGSSYGKKKRVPMLSFSQAIFVLHLPWPKLLDEDMYRCLSCADLNH
ncbi:hypothetical protein ANCDUO_11285 [Ancylostoma duodenale]|uniref:Uncharacterized protein n=1 Tax=Ancylostoma duodenale TaxID=51022 RepID=A0A0C2CP61_9BILA|nr:hypothetical protein ANCDUO_11285 [Ancylostoma duodenale]